METTTQDRSRLLQLIARFRDRRVALVGDLVADEFVHGEIARVSREAPVLILKERERRILPGGGANAASNLVDLGAKVTLAGVVGEDEAGDALLAHFEGKGVATDLVSRRTDYRTPTKSRVLGTLGHGRPQQIVRVDREPQPLAPAARRQLTQSLAASLAGTSALLVSDYGYGATSAQEVEFLRRRNGRRGLVVTVDSRYDLATYRHVTASTPNEPEIEAAFGARIGNDMELLRHLAEGIIRRRHLEALLVTRGRDGMILYQRGRRPRNLAIFGSDQVADVTGAGDTVIAAFTLTLAAGGSFWHAAMIANCAGGLVVMKSGTATVSARELAEGIRNA